MNVVMEGLSKLLKTKDGYDTMNFLPLAYVLYVPF